MSWRITANDEQLAYFAAAYEPKWRLWHLHAIKVALDHRDEIRSSVRTQPASDGEELDDSTLYGPVTTTLHAAAIAETVMYAEDLFTLLHGLRDPQRFVAATIEYPGSRIDQLVVKLERLDADAVARAFFVPTADALGIDGVDCDRYAEALLTLHAHLQTVIGWWRRYRFVQQQYKHGGSFAFRPFGGTLPEETVQRRKQGEAPPIYVLDNADINDATIARSGGVLSFVSSEGAEVLMRGPR